MIDKVKNQVARDTTQTRCERKAASVPDSDTRFTGIGFGPEPLACRMIWG
jgi:hypothetical protein